MDGWIWQLLELVIRDVGEIQVGIDAFESVVLGSERCSRMRGSLHRSCHEEGDWLGESFVVGDLKMDFEMGEARSCNFYR